VVRISARRGEIHLRQMAIFPVLLDMNASKRRSDPMGRLNSLMLKSLGLIFLVLTLQGISQEKPISVWALSTGSKKVYHCPGSKWYGVGSGTVLNECQAIKEGYQPMFGHGCGSVCR